MSKEQYGLRMPSGAWATQLHWDREVAESHASQCPRMGYEVVPLVVHDGELERGILREWQALRDECERSKLTLTYVCNAQCFAIHCGTEHFGDHDDLASVRAWLTSWRINNAPASSIRRRPRNAPGAAPAPVMGEHRFYMPGDDGTVPLRAEDAFGITGMGSVALSSTATLRHMLGAIFAEALTWDQQARVLERLGWKREERPTPPIGQDPARQEAKP